MAFNASASKAYGASFDSDGWNPTGMPDAVQADEGFGAFVANPLKAHEDEMRMAGDGLMNFVEANEAFKNSRNAVETAEIRASAKPPGQGGGGASQALGIAGKVLPMVMGAFCDMRLKEDVTPLRSAGDVNDHLTSMALSVHHLRNVCS